jgi:hypothetical protein
MKAITASLKGIYRDIIKDCNGNVLHDGGWRSNRIVNNCRGLLAAFMKNDPEIQVNGIYCLKIGEGDKLWDANGAPSPLESDFELTKPSPFEIPLSKLKIAYLNGQDVVVTGPTNRLQITAALDADEPPPTAEHPSSYPLREFGLFGNIGGEDYMIDYIRHPVIYKDASTTLVRVVRLYF